MQENHLIRYCLRCGKRHDFKPLDGCHKCGHDQFDVIVKMRSPNPTLPRKRRIRSKPGQLGLFGPQEDSK